MRLKVIPIRRWPGSLPSLSFKDHRLSEITVAEVDRYKQAKVREGKLQPPQINKSLKRLSQILDVAVDYGHLPSNPAASKGGRRRVKETPPPRSWVEPEQLMALLDAPPSATVRYSPPWPVRACESGSCARLTGATSTSPPAR